jgi:hypothetical protein
MGETVKIEDNARYIQRAVWNPTGARDNLDAFLRWKYMGSAEFEFGALPRTVKLMRSLHRMHPMTIREIRHGAINEHIAFVVASETGGHLLAAFVFRNELDGKRVRRKERTALREHYTDPNHYGSNSDCWLNILPSTQGPDRTKDPLYSEETVQTFCLDEDRWHKPFRPFFMSSRKEAAEAFLGRMET